LQPCANDAVGSLSALGVRGDIAFAEYGNMPLSSGQDSIAIEFLYEKTDWRYVFFYLYVGNFDGVPNDAIQCVPGSQTTLGFSVKFSGAPTTDDSILFWYARIPDNLQLCQSLTSEPKYAIVPPHQEGVEPLIVDADFVNVNFPEEHPTDDYWLELAIEADNDIDPPQVFAYTVNQRTETGFRLNLSGEPTEEGYTLRWRIS
jgi:hypothetical protein